jgi:benzodiazapine receptor
MKQTFIFFVFLILNFGALALGSWLMGASPVENQWYIDLNKAPWTPPGWVFGVAWTSIMLLFTVYLTISFPKTLLIQRFILLFGVQWLLNVMWNPVFFHYHFLFSGMIMIVLLLVSLLLLHHQLNTQFFNWRLLLVLPYMLWLCVAFSLNAYSWWAN